MNRQEGTHADNAVTGKTFDCPDGRLPRGSFDNCTFYTHGKFKGLYHESNRAVIQNCTVNDDVVAAGR